MKIIINIFLSLFVFVCSANAQQKKSKNMNAMAIRPLIVKTKKVKHSICIGDTLIKDKPVVEPVNEDLAFRHVELMPSFEGGEQKLEKYIHDNVIYPNIQYKINDTVEIEFIVEVDGTIIEPKINKSAGKQLDLEAIRLVKKMPKWLCGKQNGKPVRCYAKVSIPFNIDGE